MPATLTCCKCGYELTRPDINPPEPPFPKLLNLDSNYVLPAAQRSVILNSISSPLHDVSQLNQDICACKEPSLSCELRRKRSEAQSFARAQQTLVAPIRQMPAEIITDIFLHCIEDSLAHPILLASICSRWRAIALASTRLWASIKIVVTGKNSDSQSALAASWLSRAGKQPLSINLRRTIVPNSMMQPIIELFVTRCEQWHTVHLSLRGKSASCLLGATNRLHRLENLTFECAIAHGVDLGGTDIASIFAAAPRLRSLSFLHGFSGAIPQLPWKQLQELVIGASVSVKNCREILKLMPDLQRCEICSNIGASGIPYSGTITLPVLRGLADILSSVRSPVIEDLRVSFVMELTTAVTGALVSALSGGALVKLVLKSAPAFITPASMVAILRATPKLQELLFQVNSVISPEILKDFSGPDAYLVPDLQKLELECYGEPVDVSTFAGMIEGRCLPNVQSPLKQAVLKRIIGGPIDPAVKYRLRQIRNRGVYIQVVLADNTPVDLDSF
ncbi:hypothetical protein FIBSPDRAFT_935818 [Athelia psychrophila]|uniref:F-box domain-containing protein n=1 Tax=Athelia psychrophila TaxID=1759441 RepID=A0A166D3Y5_9AGAM|nr:hypothetical protein FIBSPDRAFT_935818 [Fibularhizoctonia sp. CBS 109695]